MKYSLDLSNPWLTKYFGNGNMDCNKQSLEDNHDIFKVWLANSGHEILKLFSTNGRHDFAHKYGLVPNIKYRFLNEVS